LRIALITDLHYGVRGDHQAFLDNNKKFFDETFFPYLQNNKIQTIVCLGDLLDRRKYINYYTASRLRKDFIEPMNNMDLEFHWILGNHDLYYRQVNTVSAASELPFELLKFKYYADAEEVTFDGTPILFVPWICESNKDQVSEKLKTTKAEVVFGHLALIGFEMYKGQVNHADGESKDNYDRFKLVASGHFHHKSNVGNIHYLGAHAEFIWSDWNDPRGFHIFDTKTYEMEFVPNPFNMFEKVYYDDVSGKYPKVNFDNLKGKIVKLIIKSQTNSDQYNWFVNQIEAAGPLELVPVQDHLNFENISDETIVSETKDTLTLMKEYISQSNNVVNSSKLDKLITELYHEAMSVE